MRRLLMISALTFAGAVPAVAQDYYGRPLTIEPGYYGTPVDALPTPFSHGGTCVRRCANDYSPCDPDYWKNSDRRCDPNRH